MEKKPEIDGSYIEVEAADLITKSAEAGESKVLVVTNTRLELAGDDRERFVAKFKDLASALSTETEGMDDEQKSFYILRHMLLS